MVLKTFCLFCFFMFYNSFAQESIAFKDFNQINLEDLNTEGDVGKLMMKSHESIDLDSTVYYIKEAEKLSLKSKNTLLIPYIYYHYGFAYFNKQNYKESQLYLNKCIEKGYKYNLSGMLYESFNLLGVIKGYQADDNSAIDFYKKALEYAPTKIDSVQLKVNISSIYINTDKIDIAKSYLEDVFKYDKEYSNNLDPYWLVYANLNYANTIKTFRAKQEHIKKALEYANKAEDEHLKLQVNIDLASLYLKFKMYNEALILNNSNLLIAQDFNSLDSIVRIKLIMAGVYYGLKDYKKSIRNLNFIKLNNYPNWMRSEVNQLTYNNLFELKEVKNAFVEAKKHIAYLDSLVLENEEKSYAEYAKKYETEKKNQENLLLKRDNQIQVLIISKEKSKRYFLTSLLAFVLFVLLVLFYRFRSKKKIAAILLSKNITISKQYKALEIANNTKQKFFSIIAHDLINPFNSLLGYSNLLKEDYHSFNENDKIKFITIINKHVTQNYNLVKNLLDWARAQQNGIVLTQYHLNIRSTVLHIMEYYSILSKKKNIGTSLLIDPEISIYADQNCLKTIITNLYSNAIKFSSEKSIITIVASSTSTHTNIEIIDQGVGMSQEQIDNLFNISKTTSTKGTNKEKGTGLGLLICKEFVELHNGSLSVNSELGIGTNIKITFLKKQIPPFVIK